MKTRRKNEELVKVGYRLPARLKNAVEEKAVSERRSVNDQVIVLLEKGMSVLEKADGKPAA